ncbi:MAG: uncharacterized protein K0S47_924 [Herbinix sp.]|jgi:uncharacterized membrane protein|nr:uncharacterized protein [Herbinix sp.]
MTTKKQNNQTSKKSNMVKILTIAVPVILLLLVYATWNKDDAATNTNTEKEVVKDADLVIPIDEVTDTATFYPVEIDGTKMEVIAVVAPDKSVRTAFNTCQVCYSSGRGYYVQEGDSLVCQNCGNRFGMNDVEVTKGGCNPVPITPEYKTVDDTNITISKDFLTEAKVIFENWGR